MELCGSKSMELLSEFIEFVLKAQKAQIKAQQMKDGLEKLDSVCDACCHIPEPK
jgi:hypothetical protein